MRELEQLRADAAQQIRGMRAWERNGDVHEDHWNRDVYEYLLRFDGLSGVLDYTRKLDLGNRVLDIGVGKGKGISQLAQSTISRSLTFEATMLTGEGLDKSNAIKYHRTSAEELRDIKDSSISLILALNSIAYSKAPELVVESMDRVLVPGGVFKGVFRHPEDSHGKDSRTTPEPFVTLFSQKGYDLYTANGQVLLGIKSGRAGNITAEQLSLKDRWMQDSIILAQDSFEV